MWRVGSPMQISNDINPTDFSVGVPPIGSDLALLVDDLGDFLVDINDNKLIAPEE